MRTSKTTLGECIARNIKRKTRKQYSAEEKIRIVLDGLRGEDSIAELCRREGISQGIPTPKKRGPDKCAPVMSLAMALRDVHVRFLLNNPLVNH